MKNISKNISLIASALCISLIALAASSVAAEEDPYKAGGEFKQESIGKMGAAIEQNKEDMQNQAKAANDKEEYTHSNNDNSQFMADFDTDPRLGEIGKAQAVIEPVIESAAGKQATQAKNLNNSSSDPNCKKNVNKMEAEMALKASNSYASSAGPITSSTSGTWLDEFVKIDPETGETTWEVGSAGCSEQYGRISHGNIVEDKDFRGKNSELFTEAVNTEMDKHKNEQAAKLTEFQNSANQTGKTPEELIEESTYRENNPSYNLDGKTFDSIIWENENSTPGSGGTIGSGGSGGGGGY